MSDVNAKTPVKKLTLQRDVVRSFSIRTGIRTGIFGPGVSAASGGPSQVVPGPPGGASNNKASHGAANSAPAGA